MRPRPIVLARIGREIGIGIERHHPDDLRATARLAQLMPERPGPRLRRPLRREIVRIAGARRVEALAPEVLARAYGSSADEAIAALS